jgi:hypothetical protein
MTPLLIIAVVIVLISMISYADYRRKQTAKMLIEDFLSILSSSFHEIKWKLELQDNQDDIKSPPEILARKIIVLLKPMIESELKQLLLCINCFPSGKFKYFSGDDITNKFVNLTLLQIKKLQESAFYDQMNQKEVLENFFVTMENNVQTLLSKNP